MFTSATRAKEIKRQAKAKRNVARKSLLNEERKIHSTVKKTTLKVMTNLQLTERYLLIHTRMSRKKSAAKYNKTKNNIVKRKMEDNQEPIRSYLQKQLEKNLKMVDFRGKKISKWLIFVETEIAFFGLLLISCAITNLTMNK